MLESQYKIFISSEPTTEMSQDLNHPLIKSSFNANIPI